MKNNRVRNQRVSNTHQRRQQQLLEVTVRRDVAASIRNKAILAFTFKALLFVLLGVGAYFGGREALRRFLWENPDYYLSDVNITTDGALTREQVLGAGGIVLGRNIFKVNLTKAREGIGALAQAERVEIQRVLPNRLNVSIRERRPVAWVTPKPESDPSLAEKAHLIDEKGMVMGGKTILPEYLLFPVIVAGPAFDNLEPGRREPSLEMQAALRLVVLNADSTRFQARLIDISKGYCLKVTTRTHAQVTFGLDNIDRQLDQLNRLLDHLQPTHREIQTVNLLAERNMPVTFMDQAPAPDAEDDPDSAPPRPEPPADKPQGSKNMPAAKPTPAPAPRSVPSAKPTPSPTRKESVKPSAAAREKRKQTPTPRPRGGFQSPSLNAERAASQKRAQSQESRTVRSNGH